MEKAIKTRRAKLVLLAPNIASLDEAGAAEAGSAATAKGDSGDQAAEAAPGGAGKGPGAAAECPASALVALAAEREVPLVFALSRQKMGKVGGLGSDGWGLQELRMMRLVSAGTGDHLGARVTLAAPCHPPFHGPQLLGQRKRASAFAVLDANGVFEELRRVLAEAEAGRREWQQRQRQQGAAEAAEG